MPSLPSSYDSLERYTDHLCEFIATPLVRQLTGGIHVNDALIHNAWDTLPQEWTSWWASWPDHRLAQQDLIDSIGTNVDEQVEPEPGSYAHSIPSRHSKPRPQSLSNWLATIKSLALPRIQRPGPTTALPEVLTTRMKTKKIAEVSRAAAYVHDICASRNVTRVIDMGSGQGYLSNSLAYLFPHLQVLSIDGSESQILGSKAFSASLGIPESRLKHIVHWIDGLQALATVIQDWAGGEKCMLVGLHACGSLSEHMLKYFTTVPCIDSLAVVGCCFNHIVPRSPQFPEGFPISSSLRQKSVVLSPTALMAACQAPTNWAKQGKERRPEEKSVFGRRRLYRAILEKLFFDKGIEIDTQERPAWGTRKGDLTDFSTFAHRAMECLKIDDEKISTVELVSYEERYRDCEGQIAILGTLSVLCCQVVESLIAMDRYWFLIEQRADEVDIVPIFDFRISPRNLMIVAAKVDSKLQ